MSHTQHQESSTLRPFGLSPILIRPAVEKARAIVAECREIVSRMNARAEEPQAPAHTAEAFLSFHERTTAQARARRTLNIVDEDYARDVCLPCGCTVEEDPEAYLGRDWRDHETYGPLDVERVCAGCIHAAEIDGIREADAFRYRDRQEAGR